MTSMTPQQAAERKDVAFQKVYEAEERGAINAASDDPLRIADDDAFASWHPKRHRDTQHEGFRLLPETTEALREAGEGNATLGLRWLIGMYEGRTDLERERRPKADAYYTNFRLTAEEVQQLETIGGGQKTRGIERLAAQV